MKLFYICFSLMVLSYTGRSQNIPVIARFTAEQKSEQPENVVLKIYYELPSQYNGEVKVRVASKNASFGFDSGINSVSQEYSKGDKENILERSIQVNQAGTVVFEASLDNFVTSVRTRCRMIVPKSSSDIPPPNTAPRSTSLSVPADFCDILDQVIAGIPTDFRDLRDSEAMNEYGGDKTWHSTVQPFKMAVAMIWWYRDRNMYNWRVKIYSGKGATDSESADALKDMAQRLRICLGSDWIAIDAKDSVTLTSARRRVRVSRNTRDGNVVLSISRE